MSTTYMPVTKPHRFGVPRKEVTDLADKLRAPAPAQAPAENGAVPDQDDGKSPDSTARRRAW